MTKTELITQIIELCDRADEAEAALERERIEADWNEDSVRRQLKLERKVLDWAIDQYLEANFSYHPLAAWTNEDGTVETETLQEFYGRYYRGMDMPTNVSQDEFLQIAGNNMKAFYEKRKAKAIKALEEAGDDDE